MMPLCVQRQWTNLETHVLECCGVVLAVTCFSTDIDLIDAWNHHQCLDLYFGNGSMVHQGQAIGEMASRSGARWTTKLAG